MNGEPAAGTPVPFCPYSNQHPRIDAALIEHNRRITSLEAEGREDRKDLWIAVGRVEKAVENIQGRLVGYVLAAILLTGIVSFLATRAIR